MLPVLKFFIKELRAAILFKTYNNYLALKSNFDNTSRSCDFSYQGQCCNWLNRSIL